jgi:hypothetical protein
MQRGLVAKNSQSNQTDNKEDLRLKKFLFLLKFRRYYVNRTYPELCLRISQLGHYL